MEYLQDVRVTFGAPLDFVITLLLVILLLAWVLLDLRQMLRTVAGARPRAVLGFLRVLTALAALVLLLQPQWLVENIREGQGRVSVLLDVSRSMALPSPEGGTRAEQAQALLASMKEALPELAVFSFGAETTATTAEDLLANYPTADDQTHIGEALIESQRLMGAELGAIVLVSDGSDSAGALGDDTLKALRTRVHTVAMGGDGPERDDAIIEVRADPVAFLRQRAEVEVVLRRTPAAAGTIKVSLRSEGALLTEVTAIIDEEGNGRVVIPFEVDKLGRAAYTVSIPVAEEDGVPQNNERAFLMRVKRDRLRVLLVCGRPAWDARFLRAFLKGNPSIDLITFFILRTANDMTMAAPDELSLIPFPTDELFREHLTSFDLVIFQDFDYGPYQMARYLPRVREYVRNGGSFAMIGGELSFSAGGYRNTPIADALPVSLLPEENTLSEVPFRPSVAEGMLAHPLVELVPDPTENARLWRRLAPLQGSNLLGEPAADASVLLEHPSLVGPGGTPRPILVVGPAGEGRSLALAVDSSYRWGITTAGQLGDASTYDRFWDRALRWLTRDPLLEASQVHTDRERYGPAAAVRVDYLARDGRYRPVAAEDVQLQIANDEGEVLSQVVSMTDALGRGEARLQAPETPGAYQVQLKLGDATAAAESFVVETGGQELSHPSPNRSLLETLAARSGGQFYGDGTLDPHRIERSRSQSLGVDRKQPLSHPLSAAFLVALLTTEWVLRRRWGLR